MRALNSEGEQGVKMKICLIMPLDTHNSDLAKLSVGEIMEPMGLAFISAAAREKGHEIHIIDRRILFRETNYDLNILDKKNIEMIQYFGPDYIGFHLNVIMIKDVQHFSSIIKDRFPFAKIMVGGPQATLFPEEVLRLIAAADIIVRGEGEMTVLDVVNGEPLNNILGITYRTSYGIETNPDRPLINNLDNLPLPSRDLLDIEFYFNSDKNILVDYSKSYHGQDPKMAEILTSRGCPMQCTFCACPNLWEKCVRYHSDRWVIKDLLDIILRGANFAYFNDDVFTINRKRVFELCKAIKREGLNSKIQWVAQSRPEHVEREMLLTMKEAGCVRIEFGFESGSQRILDLMNKRTSIKQYLKAVEITRQVGLNIQANIIFGYPGETKEDVNKTIDFLKTIKVDSVLLNAFQPIPGTDIYKVLKSDGYVLNDSFIPSHPFLTPYNFTSMNDEKYKEMFWRLMELAPEALNYWEKNREMFNKVAIEMDVVFALMGKGIKL